jgi:hypothetical protein
LARTEFSLISLKGEETTEIPSSRQLAAVIYFLRSPSILLPEKVKSKTQKIPQKLVLAKSTIL